MTVETDTIKNPKESPSKTKRKRASRSSSSGSSSSGTSSSSSASSRSSSSSSSNSSSSTSRSSSAASSPGKKNNRNSNKVNNSKPSNKKSSDHPSIEEKKTVSAPNQTRRNPSPLLNRQEKEKEPTKIYIGKLSLNVNKDHLAEIFGTFGEIKEIDLPSHRIHPHLHRGYAHIEYTASTGAEQASKYMDCGQIDGQEIVCVTVHGQQSHVSADRNRRERSPYNRRRRRSPLPLSRHYPPPRRMGDRDRDRDRGRYNDRRGGYSPPSKSYRRGQSPSASSRRPGISGNTAESPKRKERRYSRSSSSESK